MAHGPDFAAGRAGRLKDFYDARLAACEQFAGVAFRGPAINSAIHSLLPFRARGDSLFVSFPSPLLAAALGWNRAVAGNFSGWEKARCVPPVVCAVVRADALQVAPEFTISAGISGSGHCNPLAVLGRARDGSSVLGAVHDARGFARHIAAYFSGDGCNHRGHEFSEDGWKIIWTRFRPAQRRTGAFDKKKLPSPKGSSPGHWTVSLPPFNRYVHGGAARLPWDGTIACANREYSVDQVVGPRHPLDRRL